MRYAVLLIATAALIGAGAPAFAGGQGKGPPFIDECEAACLEDAAICLEGVKDEFEECLASGGDWETCLAAAKVGIESCATEAEACLSACDD